MSSLSYLKCGFIQQTLSFKYAYSKVVHMLNKVPHHENVSP